MKVASETDEELPVDTETLIADAINTKSNKSIFLCGHSPAHQIESEEIVIHSSVQRACGIVVVRHLGGKLCTATTAEVASTSSSAARRAELGLGRGGGGGTDAARGDGLSLHARARCCQRATVSTVLSPDQYP